MGAVAFTALAAMFPPALPSAALRHPAGLPGALPGPAADPAARFVPQPDPAPSAFSSTQSTPLSPGRSGVIPFAGRQLPLPAGAWQKLAFGRDEGAESRQVTLFARIQDRRLTGLLAVVALDALSRSPGLLGSPVACTAADVLAGDVAPAPPDRNPYVHECWTISPADLAGQVKAESASGLMHRAFDHLHEMGVAIPDRLLSYYYFRSDETGWLLTQMYLPDRRGGPPDRRLVAWARRFAGLMHRGFEGKLAAADLSPALARDPD